MNLDRYRRQVIVKEFGENGQNILSKKHVVAIGGGGLGSNSSEILVRTGIGSIDVIDNDLVKLSNLHRTSIFTEEDINKFKCQILEEKLKRINSNVKINGINKKITKENIDSIVKNADVILDGTDNMQTRFLINDFSIKKNIPWVYAGVHGTVGMVMVIIPKQTPCLQCISQNLQNKPLAEIPVFANLPLSIASIQCTETIKLLIDKDLSGLIIYDIWKQKFDQMNIKRNPACDCCSKEIFEFL
jgi:adenylyltransferase/sulfurtransferase